MSLRFRPFLRRLSLACLSSLVLTATAQDTWPTKPVQMIVPFPPGGGADMSARMVADRLSDELGVRVVVDNRPGADGNIGMRAASQARADGHTIVFVVPSVIQNPLLQTLDYDPASSLQPLAKLTETSLVLLVRPSLKLRTWEDFLKWGRSASTPVNCAASGANPLVACELLKRQGQVPLNVIPYKGNNPAMNDLLGGHVDLLFDLPSSAKTHTESRGVWALATTGRSKAQAPFQDLPLTKDLVPGFIINTWQGLMTPTGLPDHIRQRLESALAVVMADPQIVARVKSNGLRPAYENAGQFGKTLSADGQHYKRLFQETGMMAR